MRRSTGAERLNIWIVHPVDDGPPVTAVVVLDCRPSPERVLRRKGQDRDHLKSMQPGPIGGIEPRFGFDDHGGHIGRDQSDQAGADQPTDPIARRGLIENLMNAPPQ